MLSDNQRIRIHVRSFIRAYETFRFYFVCFTLWPTAFRDVTLPKDSPRNFLLSSRNFLFPRVLSFNVANVSCHKIAPPLRFPVVSRSTSTKKLATVRVIGNPSSRRKPRWAPQTYSITTIQTYTCTRLNTSVLLCLTQIPSQASTRDTIEGVETTRIHRLSFVFIVLPFVRIDLFFPSFYEPFECKWRIRRAKLSD